ncbi:MAG TPA: Glu-tRNA(Gln) amidotransferase subunit GatD [Thermoplasmata archaeon]|nr:Glu-tRNA(Gln) amidotransferase subunit GatD [Thermoplasmata archaeon]
MSAPSDPWDSVSALPTGQRIELTDDRGHNWTGTIVPRHDFSGDRVLQLKLDSGYNIGVRIEPTYHFRLLETSGSSVSRAARSPVPTVAADAGPWIALLTTGGTIASRVDYETGGVRPVKEEREILDFFPELESSGRVRIVPVFDRLSEDLVPDDWRVLAEKVVATFGAGAKGIVIAHGTDTLGFTAAALSFLLPELPGPVVLVGAQRSPDRPSSDGASNLRAAVDVAHDPRVGEVVVVMHAGPSDDRFAIHRGTWVRKMHSSRRDAFRSRNGPPLGVVEAGKVELQLPVRPPKPGPARVDGPIDTRAALLWFYPGLTPERAALFAEGCRGVVLAGTGLGHVGADHLPWIRAATQRGMVVAMTTQCLEGNVEPYVYSTGRELLRAGVLYLGDLLPETAYAKMVWALGHATDAARVSRLLSQDRAGEFHDRHDPRETA